MRAETRGTARPKGGSFFGKPIDKGEGMVYNTWVRGYSLMVKLQLPKLATRVRFPLPAPAGSACSQSRGQSLPTFLLSSEPYRFVRNKHDIGSACSQSRGQSLPTFLLSSEPYRFVRNKYDAGSARIRYISKEVCRILAFWSLRYGFLPPFQGLPFRRECRSDQIRDFTSFLWKIIHNLYRQKI